MFFVKKDTGSKVLGLLFNGKEAVAWVFGDFHVCWKVGWFTLCALFVLAKEVNCLTLAAAKNYVLLVQVVRNTFRVCVRVSCHDICSPPFSCLRP